MVPVKFPDQFESCAQETYAKPVLTRTPLKTMVYVPSVRGAVELKPDTVCIDQSLHPTERRLPGLATARGVGWGLHVDHVSEARAERNGASSTTRRDAIT